MLVQIINSVIRGGYYLLLVIVFNSDSLQIKLVGKENESIPFATCVLKRDTTTFIGAITGLDGETFLPAVRADSLIISALTYMTIRCKYDSSVSSYVLRMEEGDDYYRYFTDEKWTFKKNRLLAPSTKSDKQVNVRCYERKK